MKETSKVELNQREVGFLLGCTHQEIALWINEDPKIRVELEELAVKLNKSLHDLGGYE